MRSNYRVLLAIVLLAGGTWALAQDPNPSPPPQPAPPAEATPPAPPAPPEQQSVVPPVVPVESKPVLALTPIGVDTTVVSGKKPAPKAPRIDKKAADAVAKKPVDEKAVKSVEAATVAAFGDTAAPPPGSPPNASETTASSPATDNPAPPLPAEAARGDVIPAQEAAQKKVVKEGALLIALGFLILVALTMALYIARGSASSSRSLSIFPDGPRAQPRSPLASGRHL